MKRAERMIQEYMRQIKSLLIKYKNDTITEEENLFLEYLLVDQLERIVLEKELSSEEQELLKSWEIERELMKEMKNISVFEPDKIEKEAYSAWESFAQKKVIIQRKRHSPTIGQYIAAGVGIAAVVALLFLIKPFGAYNDSLRSGNRTELAENTLSNQITTDKKMKRVVLPDGSVVHLNMGSKLSLHKGKFNAHTREVWLDEGEAFFEVTKDSQRPFTVHTANGLSTRVLGTSFNIRAYGELDKQVVSVKTGRVQVSSESGKRVVLDPDNNVLFDVAKGTLTAGITNGTDAADWRNGRIVLRNATIDEVAFRLKQYYDVEIVNREKISKRHIVYFSFTTDMSLKEVAGVLADIYQTGYKIKDHTITFI